MTDVQLWVDENVPPRIVDTLRALGVDAQTTGERGTKDVDWLTETAGTRIVVLSGDKRIRKHRAEREAVLRARTTMLFIDPSQARDFVRTAALIRIGWEQIVEAEESPREFFFKLKPVPATKKWIRAV